MNAGLRVGRFDGQGVLDRNQAAHIAAATLVVARSHAIDDHQVAQIAYIVALDHVLQLELGDKPGFAVVVVEPRRVELPHAGGHDDRRDLPALGSAAVAIRALQLDPVVADVALDRFEPRAAVDFDVGVFLYPGAHGLDDLRGG